MDIKEKQCAKCKKIKPIVVIRNFTLFMEEEITQKNNLKNG